MSAKVSTQNTPCTNRPVECALCKEVYWSYSFNRHYEQNHPMAICHEIITGTEIEVMTNK